MAAASEAYLSLQISHDALQKQLVHMEAELQRMGSRGEALQELLDIKDLTIAQQRDSNTQEVEALQKRIAELNEDSAQEVDGLHKRIAELSENSAQDAEGLHERIAELQEQLEQQQAMSPLVVTHWSALREDSPKPLTPVVGTPTKKLAAATPARRGGSVSVGGGKPLDKQAALASLKSKISQKKKDTGAEEPGSRSLGSSQQTACAYEDIVVTTNDVVVACGLETHVNELEGQDGHGDGFGASPVESCTSEPRRKSKGDACTCAVM